MTYVITKMQADFIQEKKKKVLGLGSSLWSRMKYNPSIGITIQQPFILSYVTLGTTELKSVCYIVISSCIQHGECSTSLPEKACQLPDPGVFVVANYQKRSGICLMAIQELQKLPQPVP